MLFTPIVEDICAIEYTLLKKRDKRSKSLAMSIPDGFFFWPTGAEMSSCVMCSFFAVEGRYLRNDSRPMFQVHEFICTDIPQSAQRHWKPWPGELVAAMTIAFSVSLFQVTTGNRLRRLMKGEAFLVYFSGVSFSQQVDSQGKGEDWVKDIWVNSYIVCNHLVLVYNEPEKSTIHAAFLRRVGIILPPRYLGPTFWYQSSPSRASRARKALPVS